MALHGSLKDLRLGEVLQTVLGAGHAGLLRVRQHGDRTVIEVGPEGLRLVEPEVLSERMILDAFVARGLLDAQVAGRARAQAGDGGTFSAIEGLLNAGQLPAREIDALLLAAAEDHVLDVLAWTDGDFRFEEGARHEGPIGPVARVRIDPDGLMLRAAQRLDERREISERLGPHTLLVLPGAEKASGSVPAEAVAAHLDGRMLLDEIALKEGITLFAAQKAALELVETRAARTPGPQELAQRAKEREQAGDARAASALLLQWQAARPLDTEAFAAAAELAARLGRHEAEADALKGLGRACLKGNKPEEAKKVYERLLAKRPGDRDAIDGLRQSARIAGDEEAFAEASRALAENAIDDADPGLAAAVLQELLEARPGDVAARVLRAKALVRVGDRGTAIEEFARLAEQMPMPCRKRADREAALWCRDTVAHLAPDRGDLLRRFREMLDPRATRGRRLAIVGALVAALLTTGIILWPKPSAGLLGKARAAVDEGDLATAMALIAEIADRYPDTPECEEALALKAKLDAATRGPVRKTDPAVLAALRETIAKAAAAMARLPDPFATGDLEALATALKTPEGAPLRSETIERLRTALPEGVAALRRAAQERRDVLDLAAVSATKPHNSLARFEEIVSRAKAALDPAWAPAALRALEATRRVWQICGDAAFGAAVGEDLRAIEGDIQAAARAATGRVKDVEQASRELHKAKVSEAYESARIEAASALVRGELDRAEELYRALHGLLLATDTDPALAPLREAIDRRGIREFSAAKVEMIDSIRNGIAAASAAESTGNLAGAAAAYASLVRQFPLVRFDEVFTIPVRVQTTPPGARVSLNGKEVGASPVLVRYGWGSQAVLTVSAEGFQTSSVALRTAESKPEPEIRVSLSPSIRWTQPLVGVVEAPPLGHQGDVIVCNRSGRVERRAKETGEVRWVTDTKSVEGVRGRPAVLRDMLWVPLVEGQVARLSLETGTAYSPFPLPGRSVGDAAALGSRVAVASENALVAFDGTGKPTTVNVRAPVTAGVLAAHGGFWVGDANGGLTRLDASTLSSGHMSLGGSSPVTGLAAGARCVYAVTTDGTLHAIEVVTGQVALWRRNGLGDVVGPPAEAAGIVVVADRAGRLRLFDAADGAPKGEKDLGAALRVGPVALGARLGASLADGRFWLFDPTEGIVLTDVPLRGTSPLPVTDLGDGSVAVPSSGSSISALPLPK
jgi:outer membrane protein assembly factor BamB